MSPYFTSWSSIKLFICFLVLVFSFVFCLSLPLSLSLCTMCRRCAAVMSRGEGLSGYYRFMCRGGFYVWLQTRGMLMHDSRTGKATHIVCMNYIIR